MGVGLIAALLVALARSRRWGVRPLVAVDSGLAAAVGGLVAGRAAYVAVHWGYFQDHLVQVPQIWRGGLSSPAVLLGAVVGAVLFARWRRTDPRLLLDLLTPGAALVACSAWLGCLQAGCGWGIEVRPGDGLLWHLGMELPDIYGLRAPRVAVQLLGAGWSGLLFLLTLLIGRRWRPFPLWLFLYGGGEFGLGFLRGDLSPAWAGLSPLQIANLAFSLIGLFLLTVPGWPIRQDERP